ncbi:hypothetical protein QL285_057711 [Trifolium repens]|nr:hypothetical protein QL285_057711 [Trifolium repens]
MYGNKSKRKDNRTSLSELDQVALINRRNQSVDIQEPGSTPSALESVTFQPTTFQAPAYQPTTLQPYAKEFGCTPPALQSATFRPTTFQPYAPGLCFRENDETFKKRSQANKGNINLGKWGCLHTQGSVGFFSHAQQLIKEKGTNVDISDIHKETHIKKSTGGYVDTRYETTQRLYDDKIEKFLDKHPEYSSHDAILGTIRRDIWQEVSGLGTKNTKYGFGKLALNNRHEYLVHIPTPEERCRPVALPAAAQAEIERLTRELQAQKEKLNRRDQQDQERHEMMQQEIRRVREEQTRAMDQQRREMGAYIRELLASSSRNAPIDETNPQEDSTNSNNEDMGASYISNHIF